MDQPIVVCVYKKSVNGDFSSEYVRRLMEASAKFGAKRFLCLTDDTDIDFCETVPLTDNFPGWWSKLELFKLPENERYFYMDLDTVIIKSLSCLLNYPHKFTTLNNFDGSGSVASGVMAWEGDHRYLYDIFASDPVRYINEYTTPEKWGDQGFIRDHLMTDPERFQDIFQDCSRISSYKLSPKDYQLGSAIIAFHGSPRPHEINWDINTIYTNRRNRRPLPPRG